MIVACVLRRRRLLSGLVPRSRPPDHGRGSIPRSRRSHRPRTSAAARREKIGRSRRRRIDVRSVMVSQLSETSSSDRRLVDPASCRLGARTIPSVQRCSAGLLPHYDPPLCGEFARGHAAAGLSLMGLVNEGSSCGRPAHDHWMISPSSGQHKRHYSPIMIAPFIGITSSRRRPEKLWGPFAPDTQPKWLLLQEAPSCWKISLTSSSHGAPFVDHWHARVRAATIITAPQNRSRWCHSRA